MADKLCSFKNYMTCKDDKKLSKTRKKINRKRKDGSSKNVYGWAGYSGPPNLSGAPAGGADGGAAGGAAGGVGESVDAMRMASDVRRMGHQAPSRPEKSNPPNFRNVYKNGRSDMKFRDYLKDENEEEFDFDVDPEEPVGEDPYDDEDPYEDEDAGFDKDIWDLIAELRDDGMSIEDIADDTDLSVEDVEAYFTHFEEQDEDDYPEEDISDLDLGDLEDEDLPEDEEELSAEEKEARDDYFDEFHARMVKQRGGGFGDPRPHAEEDEEDWDTVLGGDDDDEEDDYDEDLDDEDLDDDEYERRYDVERDEEDDDLFGDERDEPEYDDEDPEYADEVQVGDWTITRLDDEDEDPELDDEVDPEFDPDFDDDEMDMPRRDDFDDDPMDPAEYAEEDEEDDVGGFIKWLSSQEKPLSPEERERRHAWNDERKGKLAARRDRLRTRRSFMQGDADQDEYERDIDPYAEGPYREEDYEYAEDAEEPSKKDQARALYRAMKSGEYTRKDIIAAFEKRLQLSPSSSTAYYERIAKEYGETEQQGGMDPTGAGAMGGMGGMDMMGAMGDEGMQGDAEPEYQDPQEWEDPHRQGVIRTVKNAHLVYKRQQDDGSFEELWIYKQGEQFQDELEIRHDVIAGTDIPVEKTQSPDGSQKAETWSVGDVQYMSITGLPN